MDKSTDIMLVVDGQEYDLSLGYGQTVDNIRKAAEKLTGKKIEVLELEGKVLLPSEKIQDLNIYQGTILVARKEESEL
jgi:hypothetical protein